MASTGRREAPIAPNLPQVLVAPRPRFRITEFDGRPAKRAPYTFVLANGKKAAGTTDDEGWTQGIDCSPGDSVKLSVGDQVYEIGFVERIGETTADVQSLLNAAGFEAGPLDGDLGPQTRRALRAFQRSAGLARTGEADGETTKRLRERHGLA